MKINVQVQNVSFRWFLQWKFSLQHDRTNRTMRTEDYF